MPAKRLRLLAFCAGLGLVIISCVWGTRAAAQSQSSLVVLTDAQGRYPLGLALEILEDPGGQLTIAQVVSGQIAQQFAPSIRETPNFGFTRSAYWARIQVRNATGHIDEWRLEVALPSMNYIELYVPNATGFELKRAGYFLPFAAREVAHPNPTFRLPLAPGVTQTFYLRFQTDGAMLLPLTLWSPAAFAEKYQAEQLTAGLAYGAVLIVLGFNLCLALFLRDTNYLYLTLAIALRLLVFAIGQDGRASQYLWPQHAAWNSWLAAPIVCLSASATLQFARTFLQTAQRVPTLHRILTGLLVVALGLAVLGPLIGYSLSLRFAFLVYLAILPCILITAFRVWGQGYLPARFFLLANVVILAQNAGEILVRFNWLPSADWFNSPVGLVVWAFLWSLAQADRIHELRRGVEGANARYAQLNTELEQRVTERTAALESNLTQLRRQNEYLTALQETTLGLMQRLELLPLLEVIVTRAAALMGTTHGQISLLEPGGEAMQERVGIGLARRFIGDRTRWGEGLTGKVWQTGQPVVVEDYRTWAGRKPEANYDLFRATVGVPLVSAEQVVGVLNLNYAEPRAFSAEEVVLLQRFAQLAAVVLDNARLFAAEREQREFAELLLGREQRFNEIARAISGTLDLPTILATVVRLTVEFVDADAGSMGLLAPDGQSFVNAHLFNLPTVLAGAAVGRGRGVAWQAIDTGQAFRLENYAAHPDALPEWVAVGVRAYLSAPILVGKTCFGELDVCHLSPEKHFSDYDLRLVEAVARQAGVAIQNAQLFEIAQRHTEELREAQLKYQTLAEQISAVTYIDVPDAIGTATYISPQIEALLGYPMVAWASDPMFWHKLVHPADYAQAVTLIETTLTQGRAVSEYRMLAHDGRAVWLHDESVLIRDAQGQPRWVQGVLVDITERKQMENALRRQTDALAALHAVALDMGSQLDTSHLLQRGMAHATEILRADRGGGIYMYEAATHALRLVEASGINAGRAGVTVPVGGGVAGRVFQTGQPLIIDNYANWEGRLTVLVNDPPSSVIGVPLLLEGHPVGTLNLFADSSRRTFDATDVHLAEMFAAQFMMTIRNTRLYEQVQRELGERKRAEDKFRQLLASAPDAIVIVDSAGKVTLANAQFEMLFGYARDEILGQAVERFLPERFHAPHALHRAKYFDQPLTRPMGLGLSLYARRKDGREFPVEISLSATQDDSGPVAIATIRDITERKQAETVLRQQNEQLAALYQITLDLLNRRSVGDLLQMIVTHAATLLRAAHGFIFLAEGDFLVLRATTPGMAPNLGSRETMPGSGVLGRVWQSRRPMVVENYDEWVEHDPNYAAQGLRAIAGVPIFAGPIVMGVLEVARSAQDNQIFTLEDVSTLSRFAALVSLVLDNTRLYQTVMDERSRLQALIEATRDGVILVSAEGRLLVINAAALDLLALGGHPETWLQKPLGAALTAQRHTAPAVQAILAALRRARRAPTLPPEGELAVLAKTLHWLNLPVLAGEVRLGHLLVLRDVTQERLLETMRQNLTNMMVHDLRNPLGVILNVLEDLETTSAFQAKMLGLAKNAADSVLEMVNTILDVSRLESGQMLLEQESVWLPILVNDLVRWQTPLANKKELTLENACPADAPSVWADAKLLRRVLQNLIGNAIKFTPAQGRVQISAEVQAGEKLMVSVFNTGAGIPPDVQGRLFEKFATGRQSGRGTGLGLAFCKLVVEAHGGRIWAESELGQGAVFRFTLPLKPQ